MSALEAMARRHSVAAQSAVAFVFPGQGSQHVGMGADLTALRSFLRLVRRAEELTGRDIARAMLVGPRERLEDTVTTQLAVLIHSVTLAELLRLEGIRPAVVAGHSLGEFSALVAGGWLDVDDALDAVARRAEAMAACCEAADGTMSAVIGLSPDELERVRVSTRSDAVIANRNSPKQSVVAGAPHAVEQLGAAALRCGATAVIPLRVSGAFHSPLMVGAQQAFASVVSDLPLRAGEVPLVSSVTGELVVNVQTYRRRLSEQIASPVRWDRAITTLRTVWSPSFIEVGPGKALRGLLRHVDRSIAVAAIDSATAVGELAGLDAA
jgi:[acyl-carrier-protein] S-malonyltransferase